MRLLLVEDNPGDARLIREMFREQGLPTDGLAHVAGLREAESHLAEADATLLQHAQLGGEPGEKRVPRLSFDRLSFDQLEEEC